MLLTNQTGNNLPSVYLALASAARTATTDTGLLRTSARGVRVIFNITAVPTVETVTPHIRGYDPYSAKYYTLASGAATDAATSGAPIVLTLYPGIAEVANIAVSDGLPGIFDVQIEHSASGSFTYTVVVAMLL